ncbi:unnamed protein product [Merluccius merluccius]
MAVLLFDVFTVGYTPCQRPLHGADWTRSQETGNGCRFDMCFERVATRRDEELARWNIRLHLGTVARLGRRFCATENKQAFLLDGGKKREKMAPVG